MKDITQFLTYLRTIISTGSVTAAAKRLYISQPYLSRTISEHERRLGYRLLDRDKRPIALTAIGVQYVRSLEQLNNQYNKLMHDLEKMADVSHLRLGINQSMSTIVAPPLLYRYHQVHSESQIAFTEGISSELGDLLLSGRIDAQLRLMPIFSNEITYYPVCELPVYLLVNDSSPLFTPGRREILTLPIKAAQFDQLAYITLDSGSGFMRQLSVFFDEQKIHPRTAFNVRFIQTAANLAYQGLGCTFVPQYCLRRQFDASQCNIIKVPMEQLSVKIVLAYRRDSGLASKVQQLIDETELPTLLQELCQD
ncbi:LysR family transcriptional regulator [Lacticaseibacillus rhamnosus]|uniref:LysR family transcriptional regulator n=1 Tax=Lacticaseibacillus rhamnosus TaxID=47715 RepID=UPI0009C171FA|nr:LysR family transcriptional regulator [Lacticaseibacillus rhamnosus]ARD30906.1 transcriptional regulator [Lacticaseibacillus rhamnosus]